MKRMKLLLPMVAIFLSIVPTQVFATGNLINVTINGTPVTWTDATPYVDSNNRTMVPLKPIGEAMGLDVIWDNTDKTVLFSSYYTEEESTEWGTIIDSNNDNVEDSFMGGAGITFTLNDKTAYTDILYYDFGADLATEDPTFFESEQIIMDTEAVTKNNRTYAPIKYLAEFYSYKVSWDQKTNTVILTSEE